MLEFDRMASLRRWLPSRTMMTATASLAFGIAAVLLSGRYLDQQVAEIEASHQIPVEPMIQVVVPSRALQAGHRLAAEDLALRSIPASYADTHAVSDRSVDAAIGQRLGFAVDAGRPLLWAHLQQEGPAVFSGRVPAGQRAMTVRVDETNALAGFLQPGDRIDLLLTHGAGGEQGVLPLITNLPVIATGIQTASASASTSTPRSFTTITVEVSIVDAQRITLAQQVGRLTAVLRNPVDAEPLPLTTITLDRLLGTPAPDVTVSPVASSAMPAAPPPDVEPGIEFIIGGS